MYQEFEQWLNGIIEENMPLDATAICFNLYEEGESNWSIQFVVTSEFDEEDKDWVCEEVFTSGEDLYTWQQDISWEDVLNESVEVIAHYLKEGKHAELLKNYEAIATGFVDGDIIIIYKK